MPEINFLKRLSPITHNTNIYQLKPVRVNEKAVLDAGRIFRLTGNVNHYELTKIPNGFVYKESSSELSMCSLSGALRHINNNLWQKDDGKSNFDITDGEAELLAKKYIEESKIVPLNECSLLRVTRLRAGTMERKTGIYNERVIDVGVVFQRLVDHVPVEGPGGKVVIYLDCNRQVTGSYRIWRQIDSVVKPVPINKLAPPKFAEDHLLKYWKDAPIKRLEVTDSRFGYFEMGEGKSQKYLQPAYIMYITLSNPESHFTMQTVHIVPAATEAIGDFMPPRKVIPAQPIRS